MISDLTISGLGVIDSAELELHPGFTAVTGETGAGKTMVVTGLGLLLGERGERSVVRTGADRLRVEGRFGGFAPELRDRVDALGGETEEEGGELLVARQVTSSGRSRSWLGGAQVTAGACAEVVGELLSIHGQSEQLRLQRPDRQRELLDAAAGEEVTELLTRYRRAWQQRHQVAAELATLVEQEAARRQEIDLLTFGLAEVERIDPQPSEDHDLAAESNRLQAVDDLRSSANSALVALAGDENATDPADALALVQIAGKALGHLAATDPGTQALADRAAEVQVQLADLAAETSAYLSTLEADPIRLETVMQRRSELATLTRKHGGDVDAVLAWAGSAATRLTELGGADERIDQLRAREEELTRTLHELGAELSARRRATADRLGELCRGELTDLAMPHARLDFALTALDEPGPHGLDAVALLFAANPGSEPGPLGRVASGGELSRVRLALEVVLADSQPPHTLVFDEVDAGVGGRVAVEIGRRLARLARRHQVVVVTHLAQVAAFADRHYVVAKADDGQVTTSGVREVAATDQAQELARMMAGLSDSDTALAHAEELLDLARASG